MSDNAHGISKKKELGCTDIKKKFKEIPEYSRRQQLRSNSILWTYICLAPPYKM